MEITRQPKGSPFSITINGRDLRSTIIDRLIAFYKESGELSSLMDPASMADEIMVTLGFNSGYDSDGDYAPGYREYAVDVGLISEPKGIDFAKHSESYKKHIGTEQQQATVADLNNKYGVKEWTVRGSGTMVVTDDDGDTYDVRPDGSIV